jgi:hypothetical protein
LGNSGAEVPVGVLVEAPKAIVAAAIVEGIVA